VLLLTFVPFGRRHVDVPPLAAGDDAPGTRQNVGRLLERDQAFIATVPRVDIDDEQPAGDDGDVEIRVASPPCCNLFRVGGCILEPVGHEPTERMLGRACAIRPSTAACQHAPALHRIMQREDRQFASGKSASRIVERDVRHCGHEPASKRALRAAVSALKIRGWSEVWVSLPNLSHPHRMHSERPIYSKPTAPHEPQMQNFR